MLCVTVYDAGGPYGEIIEYTPYVGLKPGEATTLLVFKPNIGYDGWLEFEIPSLRIPTRELYMRIWGNWALKEYRQPVMVGFRIGGGSSGSSSDSTMSVGDGHLSTGAPDVGGGVAM